MTEGVESPVSTVPASAPDRNLALELVRVTESAAMAAGRWIGRGDKISADQAAVDGMRLMLDTTSMSGVVVIGEGEKDEAPMLYNGEEVGSGSGPEVDVAVDPLEGTNLTAKGQPNAIATIACAERGTMFFPGAAVYMDKIACGAEATDVIDIEAPPEENVKRVAKAKGVRLGRPPTHDVHRVAVARLRSEGRSYRAIAKQLYLSPRAVERHVQGIFQKLGLTDTEDDNRRVLAVLALLGR